MIFKIMGCVVCAIVGVRIASAATGNIPEEKADRIHFAITLFLVWLGGLGLYFMDKVLLLAVD